MSRRSQQMRRRRATTKGIDQIDQISPVHDCLLDVVGAAIDAGLLLLLATLFASRTAPGVMLVQPFSESDRCSPVLSLFERMCSSLQTTDLFFTLAGEEAT